MSVVQVHKLANTVDKTPGGASGSFANVDGSLTISPTTGDVVISLDLSNENTWTADQRFNDGVVLNLGDSSDFDISYSTSGSGIAIIDSNTGGDMVFNADITEFGGTWSWGTSTVRALDFRSSAFWIGRGGGVYRAASSNQSGATGSVQTDPPMMGGGDEFQAFTKGIWTSTEMMG